MATKTTTIDIQHDQRGTIIYDQLSKDFAVYAPTGAFIGYTESGSKAVAMIDAWHYEQARARAAA